MMNKEIYSEIIIENGKLTVIATDENGVTVKCVVTADDEYYEKKIKEIEKEVLGNDE